MARVGLQSAAGRSADRDLQACGPAVRAIEHAVDDRLVDAGCARELSRLAARELQLELPELGELAGRTQARERRLGSRSDRHRPARAHALDQAIEEAEERAVLDAMNVVEHDDAVRDLAGIERVDHLGSDRRLVGLGAAAELGDERFGRGAPRRIERLERREHAFEQPLKIVAGIRRDPGDRVLGR